MNIIKLTLAAAAMAVSAGAASASSVFADSIISFTNGTTGVGADASRLVNGLGDTRVLGAPDGKFAALGIGGEITLGFPGTPLPGASLSTVYEITTNRFNDHDEAALVYSVLGGTETLLGTIFNSPNGSSGVFVSGPFDSIKIVDVTATTDFGNGVGVTTSFDGYDIDAVEISAIPLPAAGFMLLAALGGLGIAGRRKKA